MEQWILNTENCVLVNWFTVRVVFHNWTTVCIVSLIARFHGSECPLCYKSFRLEITVYPSSEVNYLTCFRYVIKVNIASCSLGDCNVMLCYLPCHKWLNSGVDVETCTHVYAAPNATYFSLYYIVYSRSIPSYIFLSE
jgi:hypothetical protein